MVRPLNIRPRQAVDLTIISEVTNEQFESIVKNFEGLDSPIIEASELRSTISKSIQSKEVASTLSGQILALAGYGRSSGNDIDEVILALLEGIKKSRDLEDDVKNKLNKISPYIATILKQESVALSAKALDLSYDYENVYRSGNIITDIRPIFDENKKDIVGAIISQTLRIQFTNRSKEYDFSIAMDGDDIRELYDACSDALEKAKSAKSLMSQNKDIKVFIAGEETYGDG